jgi:hypothetical protein
MHHAALLLDGQRQPVAMAVSHHVGLDAGAQQLVMRQHRPLTQRGFVMADAVAHHASMHVEDETLP